MTPIEAKKIIDDFHQSIKDSRPNAIVQSKDELPYSSAKIKSAHFVYAEYFVKQGFYDYAKESKEEVDVMIDSVLKKFQELIESYGLIDSLFVEDPDPINLKYREYLTELKKGKNTDFLIPNPFGETVPVNEFRNFIEEAWIIEHRTKFLSDDHNPVAAFVYDELRKKAIREDDIKLLTDLTNSSLTRTVQYPNKKTNTESVFV